MPSLPRGGELEESEVKPTPTAMLYDADNGWQPRDDIDDAVADLVANVEVINVYADDPPGFADLAVYRLVPVAHVEVVHEPEGSRLVMVMDEEPK